MFGVLPVRIWAEFTRLEVLTIAFYPWLEIDNTEVLASVASPEFIELRDRESRCGKRADLILKIASDSFDALQRDMPQWNAPKIKVVARKTGEFHDELEEKFRKSDEDPNSVAEGNLNDNRSTRSLPEEDNDDNGTDPAFEEDGDEDADYYLEELPNVMSHQAWKDELKNLKHTYHPSRKIEKRPSWMSDDGEDKMRAQSSEYAARHPKGNIKERYEEILTDSEAESGGRETAVVWSEDEDEGW